MGLEAVARSPVGVAREGVMVEEPEPVVDAIPGHRMHRDVADLRLAVRASGEPLGRIGVIAGVRPNRVLGIRPGVVLLSVDYESVDDGVGVVSLDQRVTSEAFDLHRLLLFHSS